MGANIPGKPRECLYYIGGFSEYSRRCERAIAADFDEFELGSVQKPGTVGITARAMG
jgi:hypothetical protein